MPLCIPDFTRPPSGAACGSGGVCGSGGACSECVQGAVCDTGNPCSSGAVDCSTGASSCEAVDDLPPGVGCGVGLACNASGSCSTCVSDAACDTGNPCSSGRIDCGSGGPVCIAVDDVPPGAGCGTAGVCGGAGTCSECVSGASCDTGNPCTTGRLDCAAGGAGVCVAMADLPPGTACGTGLACSDTGGCSTCVAGDACVVPGECNAGRTSCVGGVPVCRGTSVALAGAVCRAAVGACDYAERCDGVATTCPTDGRAAASTSCPGGACDAAGVCVPTCPGVGLSPCPGGCVDLSADAANCGTCGNVCAPPTGSCYLGGCECGLDAICDGVCVSLTSNRNNCGECGNRCPAGERCQGGSCCVGC